MPQPEFKVVFASSQADVQAAQSLRYSVFVKELGGDGPLVDHQAGLEKDSFDDVSQHLLLLDLARGDTVHEQIAGAYRLLDQTGAMKAGRFYSEHEYDLSALIHSGRKVLELGRSCLHPAYRGGTAMYHLWSALAEHVLAQEVEILFGVASFHGTDQAALAEPLSLLHHRHLAPDYLRPVARAPRLQMDQIEEEALDRKSAMLQIPSLIKAYLRLGGYVGQGAYLDYSFNTTDVCLVLDLAKMSEKQRRLYTREHSA